MIERRENRRSSIETSQRRQGRTDTHSTNHFDKGSKREAHIRVISDSTECIAPPSTKYTVYSNHVLLLFPFPPPTTFGQEVNQSSSIPFGSRDLKTGDFS